MKIKKMSITNWYLIPEGERPIDTPIHIVGELDESWAWSPDGIGAYYYDTLEELKSEHC